MVSPSKRGAKKLSRPRGKKIFKSKKPSKPACGLCGSPLQAVPNRIPSEMGKLALTQKRPQRPFGGVLCSSCATRVIKVEALLKAGLAGKQDVDYSLLKFARVK